MNLYELNKKGDEEELSLLSSYEVLAICCISMAEEDNLILNSESEFELYEDDSEDSEDDCYNTIANSIFLRALNIKNISNVFSNSLAFKIGTDIADLSETDHDSYIKYVINGTCHEIFKNMMKVVAPKILEDYSKKEEIKKSVIESVMLNGGDLMDLQGDNLFIKIARFQEVRLAILKETLMFLWKNMLREFKLDEHDRKLVLFDLIRLFITDSGLKEQEKIIINSICEMMDIDLEYVDEFSEKAIVYSKIKDDILELINE